MFTGLIEEIGTLKRVYKQGEAMMLTIGASRILSDVMIGDSISVNGVCLTVTEYNAASFTVDVMPQTFRHTNLKDIRSGEKVNLERAMKAGGRFGGHIVQGHVDGTGIVESRTADANAVVFTIRPQDSGLMRYIISQGSVTIDGISLTVTECHETGFSISIIPHTLRETVLQEKQTGSVVNIECDLLGKYVDHLLHYKGAGPRSSGGDSAGAAGAGGVSSTGKGLTAEFLAENGFL
ncbi:riboflavin synthase [Paenibacillus spongiae]|uniref:Riboflavin synthase n=1 Tax=Paenibacillus spongiae TaxID=2909671 RepID=A0ABY5SEE8_9BACL|nr:riboflavin synthase [Paenibacillus spongiae]UVI32342.1 riboflavin synthase [Paenibacillus spongiae]